MPLPERYEKEVPEMTAIWGPEGYFNSQLRIWGAQCEARNELYGEPTAVQLDEIRGALHLTPEDISTLTEAKGHETNKVLRLVQSRLSPEAGNYIHLGNTSSDVLDTSLALQIVDSLDSIEEDFGGLGESLKSLALQHKGAVQIGRTHGQHAIPQTFGRQALGWYAEVMRGIDRIQRARDIISYGKCSGEIGTHVFIDPELEERALAKLGLKPDEAPTQIISRDRHLETIALMVINSATLARIAMNVRLLSMTEVSEVREPFEAKSQQGSSSMPQKRNPELGERTDGLNRRTRSTFDEELDAHITWYERDLSNSSTERFTFPDLFGNLAYEAKLMRHVIDGLVVRPERMLENLNATHGAIYSSRLLNALLDSGKFSRTDGYDLVKGLAQEAMDTKVHLRVLAGQNEQIRQVIQSDEELDELFNPAFYLRNIDVAYQRLGLLEEDKPVSLPE